MLSAAWSIKILWATSMKTQSPKLEPDNVAGARATALPQPIGAVRNPSFRYLSGDTVEETERNEDRGNNRCISQRDTQ